MKSREDLERFAPNEGGSYDVIVAGGGPAGIGAAAASALQGARTLLLESRGLFGGVASTSLWMPMNRVYLDGGARGGVHDRFVSAVTALGEHASRPGKRSWVDGDGLHIHPDYLKLAVFNLLEDVGCSYQLHSPVVDAIRRDSSVEGVVVHTKKGPVRFRAAVTVDATGDGDVAFFAGAEMSSGGEDGRFMPVTLGFALGNVEVERFFAYLGEAGHEPIHELLRSESSNGRATAAWLSFDRTTVPGVVSVNNGGLTDIGIIDGTDPGHLTLSERTGAQVAADFVRIAREHAIPGLEECVLARTGAAVGVRETRRIVGDYVLTLEDACEGVEFPDVVARRYGAVDPGGLKTDRDLRTAMKSGHAYPYRSLLPKGIEHLLVAGRCGSTTQLGQAAGKSMGNMMDLGQAAGIAAALAAESGAAPRSLPVEQIQDRLVAMGVKLSPHHRNEKDR